MVLELLQQEKYLTYAIFIVSTLWVLITIRLWLSKKMKDSGNSAFDIDAEYNKILTSDEYKVKRRYEA